MSPQNIIITFSLVFLTSSLTPTKSAEAINWIQCVNEYPVFSGLGAVSILYEEAAPNEPSKAIQIQLRGPSDSWFGIGFGQHIMNNTYAILSSNDVFDVDEFSLGFHDIGTKITSTFSSIIKQESAAKREIIIERDISITGQDQVFDFQDWLNCRFELNIIEAVGNGQDIAFHESTKWNTRQITSCECPTPIPTLEPTLEPTTQSPTEQICDGAKYKTNMYALRNDSLWPQQDFVSNNCHCKFTLHKNGSLTLYGRIDEFDDFIAGWSTNTKIYNFSGQSVPQFRIESDGTITVNEYYYAPNVEPIPIWSVDIFNVDQNIRRLSPNNNNFSFHLSDECCLSIRDNNDYIYWSICADIDEEDVEIEDNNDNNKFINSLWLIIVSGLCILLCFCPIFGLFVHKQYLIHHQPKTVVNLKCADNTPTVDTKKNNLGKFDSYYFDKETTKQIELWSDCKLENDPTTDCPQNPPIFMESNYASTHL